MKKLFTPKKLLFYRIIGLLLIFTFLVGNFFMVIYSNHGIYHNLLWGEKLSIYYAFFTTQTNYLVFFYFLFYLFQSKFRNTKPDFLIRLAVTVYITITMIVFWGGLFTQGSIILDFNIYDWFSTIILHVIIPVVMIISFFATSGDYYYKFQVHHKVNLWILLLYPICYLIFVLIRGAIRYHDYNINNNQSSMLFPYFFLDFYQVNGIELLSLGFVFIFLLCVALQYFYIWVNNFYFWHNLEPTIEKKERRLLKEQSHNIFLNINKKEKISILLACFLVIINIIMALCLMLTKNNDWNILKYKFDGTAISFAVVIIIYSIIILILAIFMSFNFYWAKILLGILMVPMFVLNWWWFVGPIFDVIILWLCLSGRKLSDIDLSLLTKKD